MKTKILQKNIVPAAMLFPNRNCSTKKYGKPRRFFKPRLPAYRSDANPMASAMRFDPANGLIYLADAAL